MGVHVPNKIDDRGGVAGSLVIASFVMTTTAGASTAGVTANTITLGLITELTGPGAAVGTGMVRSAEARIDQQNAEGGVYGRKIKLIAMDDQTNPATDKTATGALISKGVFGVIDDSAVTYGGYKLLQQAGVPVTGGALTGRNGTSSRTPTCSVSRVQVTPRIRSMTTPQCSSRTMAARNAVQWDTASHRPPRPSASGFVLSCEREGLKNTFLDTTVPFGTLNVTSLVLQIKDSGANVLWLPLDGNTNAAIMTGLKQAGVKMKLVINQRDGLRASPPQRHEYGPRRLRRLVPDDRRPHRVQDPRDRGVPGGTGQVRPLHRRS